jgi:hypothetical protein
MLQTRLKNLKFLLIWDTFLTVVMLHKWLQGVADVIAILFFFFLYHLYHLLNKILIHKYSVNFELNKYYLY